MNNITLYNIADEALALEDLLIAEGGEISEDSEELELYLSNLMANKTDSIYHVLSKLEDEAELADKHMKRLAVYKKARTNAINRLKEYSILCLEKMNRVGVAGDMAEVKMRKPVKVLNVLDENKIPSEFLTVETVVTIDKKALLSALKDGLACDGANIIDGAKSIQFKLKKVK